MYNIYIYFASTNEVIYETNFYLDDLEKIIEINNHLRHLDVTIDQLMPDRIQFGSWVFDNDEVVEILNISS